MLEFSPWSKKANERCLEKYSNGQFSCLDIELGGDCNYHCAYCDSPDRQKTCSIQIHELEIFAQTGRFDWVYVCGLGEPTFNGNYDRFISILKLCKKYGMRCSTFSNLSKLNDELISFIKCGVLHILFKYDSNSINMAETLYGTRKIKEQLSNIKKIKDYVRIENGMTNLAASIVPTRLNKHEISIIVEECFSAGIFPLLGELEPSGKGQTNYENLRLNKGELLGIKEDIDRICGGRYVIPTCPAVISGIHLSYDSKVAVDEFSGMSCHWFWLKEPHTKTLLHFDSSISVETVENTIINYRDNQLMHVKAYYESDDNVGLVFGGCGGNVNDIFRQFLDSHRGGGNNGLS